MKKMITMVVAMMLVLTSVAMGATNADRFGILRGKNKMEPITGEWRATGYYDVETDTVNNIDLDVLVFEFEGNDVFAGVYTENGGVRYQEIVQYHDGYLTFAPDGEYATGTFVVFPMENDMLGAYQAADGKLFAEEDPVDFYMLQRSESAGLYDIAVYLLGDLADGMTAEEAAELAGYADELETALAELLGVTDADVKAAADGVLKGLKELPEEAKAELEAAVDELGELIAGIPEEYLTAVDAFINDAEAAIADLTEEEIAELEGLFAQLEAAVNELEAAFAEIPEEDLIAAGAFAEDVFTAIGEMTEEEIAGLEAFFNELTEAVAEIPEEDLIAAGAFVEDFFAAFGEMTAEEIAELEAVLNELADAAA